MKISPETIAILKNFASINANIVFNEGNTIKTMAEAKNIVATATVAESFPQQFGIYDLNEFLATVNLFDSADLTFAEDMTYATLSQGRNKARYYLSDPACLTTPTKDITMPPTDVAFTMTDEELSKYRKAASTFSVSDLIIESSDDSDEVTVTVTDAADATANQWTDTLTTTHDDQFKLAFDINNFKLMSGDYEVGISKALISEFVGDQVTYHIALSKSSTFGA
jgi:hypothetical protein